MNKIIRSIATLLFLASWQTVSVEANNNSLQNNSDSIQNMMTTLAGLVNERLSIMKEVAAYKWVHDLPIQDTEREKVVLQSSMESAKNYQLDPVSTKQFFEQQIILAKFIQQYWFDHWKQKGFDNKVPYQDLTTSIRPVLLELGDKILAALEELKPWEQPHSFLSQERFTFITSLTAEGLSFKGKRLLYEAVMEIKGLPQEEPIYQVARLDSLSVGNYHGTTTYRELNNYGDFGLGTFNNLDGEMVCLDGQFYQIKADGKAYSVKKGLKTPFANVTQFDVDQEIRIDHAMNLNELLDLLATQLADQDGFYAIRLEGQFESVQTRSVHAQQQPYPPLSEAVANQVTFDFMDIEGTMVGFRFPQTAAGQNAPGFHFHFLTEDRQAGGHLLDSRIKSGIVHIDHSSGIKRIDKGMK